MRYRSLMRAMRLHEIGQPLVADDVSVPMAGSGQVVVRISACAVCRTDLHVVDGELPEPKLPLVPGHEIVGCVEEIGEGVEKFRIGDRVGIPWLGWTCGECEYCASDRENLCDRARFTGYTIDGGYAEFTVADARFAFSIPEKTGDAERLGIYGFGAAAHIIAQAARFEGRKIFAFTRKGDREGQEFARKLGATWAGGSDEAPPEELDAAIIFAPVGALVPAALRVVKRGGTVVCGGIHMSEIPSFPYRDLWHERTITSVANLTRSDGEEFLELAAKIPIRTETQTFPLEQANEALDGLRNGKLRGAAVLVP